MTFIEIILGAIIAAAAIFFFRGISGSALKRFFGWTLVGAAAVYIAFSLFGLFVGTASLTWFGVEVLGLLIYGAFAYLGIKRSVWFLAAGWALHVFWDVGLHFSETILFVPGFYPGACIGFDLAFAAYILYRFYLRYK